MEIWKSAHPYKKTAVMNFKGVSFMNRKKLMSIILALSITTSLSTGCDRNKTSTDNSALGTNDSSKTTSLLSDTVGVSLEDMFSNRDKEIGYSNTDYIEIKLSDNNIDCDSNAVSIDNNIITITDEGTYVISGSLSNGQIIVDAEKTDKIQLVLNGVTINCNTSAPLYIKQADKVFVTLEKDSENVLSNKDEFVAIDDNNIDSVIYSKDDLTLNGLGTLTVNAAYGHGIVSKDDLVFTSGNYNITATSHGIQGKDSVRIAEGTFNINSGKDGIHSENSDEINLGFVYIAGGSFDINATYDGIDGASLVQIDSGTFNLTTGGGSANANTDSNGNANENWGKWDKGTRPGTPPSSDNIFNSNNSQPPNSLADPNAAPDMSTSASQKLPTDTQNNEVQTPPYYAAQPNDYTTSSQETTEDTTVSAKGVKSDGSILINDGAFTIDSSDDSIHSNTNIYINNGTFNISSGDDGIHGNSDVKITNGTITISKSYEGIEGQNIEISGGSINLTSRDDGLNAAGGNDNSSLNGRPGENSFNSNSNVFIKISGGKTIINASGDGIDANGGVCISGGETYVSGPSDNGNGALDYDGTGEITGGIFIATGSSGMAMNFGSTSTQCSILYTSSTNQNGLVSISDNKGTLLASFEPGKQYNSVVISTPEIKTGETYTLTLGSETQSIKMTSLIYGNGQGMNGGMGGQGGKMPGGNNGNGNPPPPTSNK